MIPGLRFARDNHQAALLVAAAMSEGATVQTLSGLDLEDEAACRSALAQAFRFPAWASTNWDAIADGLSDLAWLEPGPRLLVLDGLPGRAGHAPAWADVVIEILGRGVRQWASDPSPLNVVIVAA